MTGRPTLSDRSFWSFFFVTGNNRDDSLVLCTKHSYSSCSFFFFLFFCLFRCFCFASPSSSGWRRPSPLDGPDEIIQPKGSSSNSCLRGKNAPSSPPLVHFHRYKRQTHARQQPIDLQQKNIKRKRIPFLYIQG